MIATVGGTARARSRSRRLVLALGAATLLGASPLAAEVDPFYLSRLHEGIAAFERGAHGDAVTSLRIACFGMLDEPQLAECLVRLALAQAAAGDREAFSATVRRLIEGEERVGLYSKASLNAELSGPFEQRLVEWVPRATLEASTAFRRLAAGKEEAALAALAPRARRTRLEQLLRDEPREVRWPLLLARLEREQGSPRPALAAAERALALDPALVEARCLRGWARSELGQAAEAAADLAGCAEQRLMASEATAAPAAPTQLAAADQERLNEAQAQLATARNSEEVQSAYALAAEVAERYPSDRRVQHLTAEIAYRASRWNDAVSHFRRGGDPGEEQPLLLFYLAVSLWESGQRQEAAEVMRRCDGRLRTTPFVESYRRKILAGVTG